MAIPSKQIGWGTESNLLWQILKQLNHLTNILFGLKETATPKYKVYTALLTQSVVDNEVYTNSGPLTKGVTYFIDGASPLSDFTNVGGPAIGATNVYFVAINNETPNNYDDAALYSNTGAPVVTVLENTIGNIWFTYNTIGGYSIYSDNLFTTDKTWFAITSNWTVGDNFGVPLLNSNGTNLMILNTYDTSQSGRDGALANTPIEIRVYN
jgi:hypothetical protein